MQTLDVATLGQVFTPAAVVSEMISLRRNSGRTLEPSAGDGAFAARIPGCEAIEIDPRVAPPGARVMDFFDLPLTETFDTIIGNPPYVRHRDILPTTREKLSGYGFDARSNLYLHFIRKCVLHLNPGGELIFIVPRDFVKLTSAKALNAFLFQEGTVTHFAETGDSRIFGKFVPNCAVFRFQKGLFDRVMPDGRRFVERDGQLLFLRGAYPWRLADLFAVKVGAVSGADQVFQHPEGNMEFVGSRTIDCGETRRMFFNQQHPHLDSHKDALLARRIRAFSESNWWEWGRSHHVADGPRIYVNAKTRRTAPFFLHSCKNYDGSVLALFPRFAMDLKRAVRLLNEVDWADLGFVCDGRYLFSQRSLETAGLPLEFSALYPGRKAA